MRRFLYYFPRLPGVNSAILRQRGLSDLFERMPDEPMEYMISPCDAGPEDSGCIIGLGARPCEYAPSRQEWMRGLGRDGLPYWVGVEKPWPGPDDLVREVGISGSSIVLADERTWRIPLIHRWDEVKCQHVANLPKAMRPVAGGGAEIAVRPEYREADALGSAIYAGFAAGKTIPADEAFGMAVDVLRINYRLGDEEAGLLGLLSPDDVVRVLGLSIDLPTLEAQAFAMASDGMQVAEPRIEPED